MTENHVWAPKSCSKCGVPFGGADWALILSSEEARYSSMCRPCDKKHRKNTCWYCGGRKVTEKTFNICRPVHDADKLLEEWGFSFFPHVDVTVFCEKCGRTYSHSTMPLNEEELRSSN